MQIVNYMPLGYMHANVAVQADEQNCKEQAPGAFMVCAHGDRPEHIQIGVAPMQCTATAMPA